MPTSANKDIVDAKYSKYGTYNNNNMIIEGMENGEQLMDCYAVEDGDTEIIELIPKPIPMFSTNKNNIGFYIIIIFLAFMVIFVAYILLIFFWNLLGVSTTTTLNKKT